MADPSSRLSSIRALFPTLEFALHAFSASPSPFRIVRTINPTSTPPKTLYILDSSFNPPSIAHLALAISALRNPGVGDAKPPRLLLLFATQNADKKATPASYVSRLAMMTAFAEDLSLSLSSSQPRPSSSPSAASSPKLISPQDDAPTAPPDLSQIPIDIALTTAPYYTDKSTAISTSSPPAYPSNPVHVYLIGFDTLVRFCAPKYYPSHDPPLSALQPFFEAGNGLRVTERPAEGVGEGDPYGSVEQQRTYIEDLGNGVLEKEGFKREWARQIELVVAGEGVGVSSTRVREAAKRGDWEGVRGLCTEGVAGWVRGEALYSER
jgi:nicotinamide-nucleotide adenylyltransferase